MAVAVITVGIVLLLGPRAGYWSAEALVGAELFLLGLQIGTFVVANESVDWNVRLDGSDGGLIGWAMGSLLMAAFGRWLTFLFVILLVIGGAAASAALYPTGLFARRASGGCPACPDLAPKLGWRHDAAADPLPHTPTFVAPRSTGPAAQTRSQPAAYVAPDASTPVKDDGKT